ncbi:hypothetical protein SAMN05216436_12243 [bacterium A37T11]|nr:hypothetical protein SAMN05216436_12243 [bacterium A37T11]
MRAFKFVFCLALYMTPLLTVIAKESCPKAFLKESYPDSTSKHSTLKNAAPSLISNDTIGPGRIVINSLNLPSPARKHVVKKLTASSKILHKTTE